MGEGLFHLGRFPDFGRGNPPVVAPAVGRQLFPSWVGVRDGLDLAIAAED